MLVHSVGIPAVDLKGRWGGYPRFRYDVDPAEPDPAIILSMVTELNWCVRPMPGGWNLYSDGGVISHYGVYFDVGHRFVHASGHDKVFDAKMLGRTAAKRAFVDELGDWAFHDISKYKAATWLLPDQMFRPNFRSIW